MVEDDAHEDSIDIELRPSATVARRFLVLAAVMQRLSLDTTSPGDSPEAAFDLREWLRTEGLWDEATASEQAFFLRPPNRSEPDGGLDAALVAESLASVAWTLALLPTLSNDYVAKLASLIHEVPGPWDAAPPWIATQSLRPEPEIARMRELHEIWNWRFEIELDRRLSTGRELTEIDDVIQEVTQDALAAGLLAPGGEGGFVLDGVEVTAMLPGELAEHQLLSQERLIALNWICGFGSSWDTVPIDV